MRGGYYRPMWAHRLSVGLAEDGKPVAWRQQIVGQSILDGTPFSMMIKEGIDETSVEGVVDSPYIQATPHHFVGLHTTRSAVPVLWWRSVGHTHTAFVMETMVDALAAAAGQSPVAYRRAMLKGSPRHLGVLELAVAKAGAAPPTGQFRGVAVHHSFESYVAQVADVSVDKDGGIRVHRVVAAIDCGICINPAGVAAQVESAVVYGLSAALYGEITLKEGRVRQGNFDDYPVLRMNEMPKVEVHIVDSNEKSGGVGEPGTPPIAPAVANAVFAATGKRLRQLPLRLA